MSSGFWTRLFVPTQSTAVTTPWELALPYVERVVEIVILYVIAQISVKLLRRGFRRFLSSPAVRMEIRRRETMQSLADNVIRYTVYFLFALMVLQTLNFKVATLLAGAGVAGIALGFGAQSIIRDVLTGFFILFEDQYGVGDFVKIGEMSGTVISIGLRLTKIQAWTGEIAIIPNGQIQQVTNYSKANTMAIIEVGVSYDTPLDKALEILRSVMQQVKERSPDVIGDIQILGVQSLRTTDVLLRAAAECKSMTHFAVQRMAQHMLKEAFDKAGIVIPVPQTVIHKGPAADMMTGPNH